MYELSPRPMSAKTAMVLGAQVAAGLSFVHQLEFAHLDLKPANIMLEFDRETIEEMVKGARPLLAIVKIIDLGGSGGPISDAVPLQRCVCVHGALCLSASSGRVLTPPCPPRVL